MAETRNKAERDLRQDIEALKSDLDVLKKDLGQIVDSLRGTATNRAEQELEAVRRRVTRLAGELQNQGGEQLRSVEAQERPLASLAMGLAIAHRRQDVRSPLTAPVLNTIGALLGLPATSLTRLVLGLALMITATALFVIALVQLIETVELAFLLALHP